jgi:predicted nucleic acid-binding protein
MFLLDTNVIFELRKAGDDKANANVVAWLADADAETVYVSVVTLMELDSVFAGSSAAIQSRVPSCVPGLTVTF